MDDNITKDDLKQFDLLLVEQFKQIIENNQNKEDNDLNPECLKAVLSGNCWICQLHRYRISG